MTAIAMHGGETVTRAEAAVFFDRLFSLPAADTETAFYPDVIPGEWGSGDIYTAADGAAVWDGPEGRPAEAIRRAQKDSRTRRKRARPSSSLFSGGVRRLYQRTGGLIEPFGKGGVGVDGLEEIAGGAAAPDGKGGFGNQI